MRWPSLPQTVETGIGRRQILRSGATALTLLGTATPTAGHPDSVPASGGSTRDTLTPSTTDFTQQQKLAASDGSESDAFGRKVAVSSDGTTALIGATFDDDTENDFTTEKTGSAYVFTRTDGEWSQQQRLTADDNDEDDKFASGVALSDDGTTALIGAFGDQESATEVNTGAAYVFTLTDGEWTQQQKLKGNDTSGSDSFGTSVTLSDGGTTAFVGAPGNEEPNGSGSAYVFTQAAGTWTQQQRLAPDGSDPSSTYFGGSITVSDDGTTVLIGAIRDDNPASRIGGSAYVFTSSNGQWSQQQKLAADDGEAEDEFGTSVALSDDGTTALVGAPSSDQLYVFTLSDGTWSTQQTLEVNNGEGSASFGSSVSLSSDSTTAVVGAGFDDDPNGFDAGSTYVFTDSSGDNDDDGSDDNGDSNLSRFDTNNNGQIDFNEVLAAIAANNAGTEIGGESVDFSDVLEVISAHNNGTQV